MAIGPQPLIGGERMQELHPVDLQAGGGQKQPQGFRGQAAAGGSDRSSTPRHRRGGCGGSGTPPPAGRRAAGSGAPPSSTPSTTTGPRCSMRWIAVTAPQWSSGCSRSAASHVTLDHLESASSGRLDQCRVPLQRRPPRPPGRGAAAAARRGRSPGRAPVRRPGAPADTGRVGDGFRPPRRGRPPGAGAGRRRRAALKLLVPTGPASAPAAARRSSDRSTSEATSSSSRGEPVDQHVAPVHHRGNHARPGSARATADLSQDRLGAVEPASIATRRWSRDPLQIVLEGSESVLQTIEPPLDAPMRRSVRSCWCSASVQAPGEAGDGLIVGRPASCADPTATNGKGSSPGSGAALRVLVGRFVPASAGHG